MHYKDGNKYNYIKAFLRYDGEWLNNLKHGFGILYFLNEAK